MNSRELLTRFITNEFLDGNDNENIPDDLDLIKSGIVDSLGTLRIVAFLEESLNVIIEPEQMLPQNLSSIGAILGLVNANASAGQ